MSENTKILVGKIVAPQGLRGDVRVQTYTENPMDFQKLKAESEKFKSNEFHVIRRLNPTSDVIIAKIDGVDDRTAVENLRGTELFIERDALPDLAAGEYYHADLIGMEIIRDGAPIGRVAAIQNFGAGDILETDNGDMISFAGADVDLENKKIYVK